MFGIVGRAVGSTDFGVSLDVLLVCLPRPYLLDPTLTCVNSEGVLILISWLQSPSAVILEPRKIKSDTVSTVSPSISHEVVGLDAMIFVF